MRNSLGLLLRRGTVSAFSLAALCVPGGPAAAVPDPPGAEADVRTDAGARVAAEAAGLPFAQRYRALRHGGIVRAANTSVTCRRPLAPAPVSCPAARAGAAAANDGFDMSYTDVDSDPNTYNSSRATIALPAGARVAYARLYWGGNLRAGEQKPPRDNGRVLLAEPGGRYKEVLADTVVGHRVARGADAYQASADVTRLVGSSGAGAYTVAQVNVAKGHSAAGAWGGWTLVVAYEKESEPLRHLALWDGFGPLGPGEDQVVTVRDLDFPAGAAGRVGLVAYDGDRGLTGDALTVSDGWGPAVPLGNGAGPRDDVLDSTIADPAGTAASVRTPAYPNTLGYDSDVLDLGEGLRRGGDRLEFRLASPRDAAWAGVLFAAVDAKR
ncbi:DUF3344 domain-containing protein [Streptomyces apricus]|uniref:DUF3344 domain-containing protein n=1 Tax=Streptomyces apricus TaxID=1828112 RepID=A0A5A9ZWX8_9ACTN|nr:DUF3344 domain-containing protein [Streptomyces apricus]KAA0921874.1 DUF3344 domain-containing protein [Streptomyces apricus]